MLIASQQQLRPFNVCAPQCVVCCCNNNVKQQNKYFTWPQKSIAPLVRLTSAPVGLFRKGCRNRSQTATSQRGINVTFALVSVHNKALIQVLVGGLSRRRRANEDLRRLQRIPSRGRPRRWCRSLLGLAAGYSDRRAPGIPPVSHTRTKRQASYELNSLSPLCQIIFSFV